MSDEEDGTAHEKVMRALTAAGYSDYAAGHILGGLQDEAQAEALLCVAPAVVDLAAGLRDKLTTARPHCATCRWARPLDDEVSPWLSCELQNEDDSRFGAGIVNDGHIAMATGAASILVAPDFGCVQYAAVASEGSRP
jgi:hypothetical protein